jgi:hypothetical protein
VWSILSALFAFPGVNSCLCFLSAFFAFSALIYRPFNSLHLEWRRIEVEENRSRWVEIAQLMNLLPVQSRDFSLVQIVMEIHVQFVANAREQAFQHLPAHHSDHAIASLMIVDRTGLTDSKANDNYLDVLIPINRDPCVRLVREVNR